MAMTLREAREAVDWTQQDLEAASGVAQQTISKLERGQIDRVSHADVVKIIRAFHKAGLKGLTSEALFPVTDATEKAS